MRKNIIIFIFLIGHNFCIGQSCNSDNHSSFYLDCWRSCDIEVSPNSNRSPAHWLMYDLGHVYELDSTHFWNYNKYDSTSIGFRNVIIDISLDGINWTEVQSFELPQASGTSNYMGIDGPVLNNIPVRFILFYAEDNWGHPSNCAGLSEIRVNVNPTIVQNNWIGVVSSDWDDPMNWEKNVVPNRYTEVIIPANTPYSPKVNVHSKIHTLEVQQGASLDINSKRKLRLLKMT